MHRYILVPLLAAALSACGAESDTFDKMAGAAWATSIDQCPIAFTTFDKRMIRWHNPEGTVDFANVLDVADANSDEVMLTVEPSDQIRAYSASHPGISLPKNVTMGFSLKGITSSFLPWWVVNMVK